MATKKATKAKATQKKAPAKKAAPAKAKAVKKAPAKKATKKKAVAKKAAPKKAAAKKAPAKKAAAKKTAKKTTAAKPTVKKAPVKKATAKKAAPKKAPVKKAAAKKTAKKKKAVRTVPPKSAKETKAAKERIAAMLKPKPKPKHVGQAPRKTTVAASIPVPTHTPPKETPQADAKASKNLEASTDAKQDFKVHDQVVYPAHGVGKIVKLEKQEVAGISIELFVINFEQEKMRLRVPTGKAKLAGMRPLSSDKAIKDAITTLKGRARIKRTMWSRRAQEYDSKINSGEIKLVAEVVRDLFRAGDQPEQSYSERQLFEAALDRMAREVAAVRKVDLGKAIEELDSTLQKKAAAASAAAAAVAAAAAAAAEAEAEKNDAA